MSTSRSYKQVITWEHPAHLPGLEKQSAIVYRPVSFAAEKETEDSWQTVRRRPRKRAVKNAPKFRAPSLTLEEE